MELDSPNGKLLRLHCGNELFVALVVIESQRREEFTQIFILDETFLGDSEHVVEIHDLVFLEVEFHPVWGGGEQPALDIRVEKEQFHGVVGGIEVAQDFSAVGESEH